MNKNSLVYLCYLQCIIVAVAFQIRVFDADNKSATTVYNTPATSINTINHVLRDGMLDDEVHECLTRIGLRLAIRDRSSRRTSAYYSWSQRSRPVLRVEMVCNHLGELHLVSWGIEK